MDGSELLSWFNWYGRLLRSTGIHPIVFGIFFGIVGSLLVALVSWVSDRVKGLFVRWQAPPASDADSRKLRAKKLNEHIKLFSSFCNTLGAAIIGAAFIVPYIGNHTLPGSDQTWWVAAGLAIPGAGHVALRFMASEG